MLEFKKNGNVITDNMGDGTQETADKVGKVSPDIILRLKDKAKEYADRLQSNDIEGARAAEQELKNIQGDIASTLQLTHKVKFDEASEQARTLVNSAKSEAVGRTQGSTEKMKKVLLLLGKDMDQITDNLSEVEHQEQVGGVFGKIGEALRNVKGALTPEALEQEIKKLSGYFRGLGGGKEAEDISSQPVIAIVQSMSEKGTREHL